MHEKHLHTCPRQQVYGPGRVRVSFSGTMLNTVQWQTASSCTAPPDFRLFRIRRSSYEDGVLGGFQEKFCGLRHAKEEL